MNFKIVADSSADMTALNGCDFVSVPLKINTTEKEYIDNESLDVVSMLTDLASYNGKSHSSCPNSQEYLSAFGDAENIFCVTITSGLSGSYNSASVAAQEYINSYPKRHVHVIDSLSTGPENALLIQKLCELIQSGLNFDEIKQEIIKYHEHTRLIFALESMHNLSRNGRVSPIVAKVAGILGIRVIGRASDVGTLEIIEKSRGAKSAIADIVKNMISDGYKGGKVRIHHANNPSSADMLKEKILESMPDAEIEIYEARGLCSFYAEQSGLLVGFEM